MLGKEACGCNRLYGRAHMLLTLVGVPKKRLNATQWQTPGAFTTQKDRTKQVLAVTGCILLSMSMTMTMGDIRIATALLDLMYAQSIGGKREPTTLYILTVHKWCVELCKRSIHKFPACSMHDLTLSYQIAESQGGVCWA